MRQSELCREIADRTSVKPKEVRSCLESLSDVLKEKTLGEGVEVITPFGKFSRKTFAARKCRNPKTGKITMTQETRSLAFSTRKKLKLHLMEDGSYEAIPPRRRNPHKSTSKQIGDHGSNEE